MEHVKNQVAIVQMAVNQTNWEYVVTLTVVKTVQVTVFKLMERVYPAAMAGMETSVTRLAPLIAWTRHVAWIREYVIKAVGMGGKGRYVMKPVHIIVFNVSNMEKGVMANVNPDSVVKIVIHCVQQLSLW